MSRNKEESTDALEDLYGIDIQSSEEAKRLFDKLTTNLSNWMTGDDLSDFTDFCIDEGN